MKVNCHLGITFPMGSYGSQSFGKCDVEFTEVDTELDLAEQLRKGKVTAATVFKLLLEELGNQVKVVEAQKSSGRSYARG